MDSLSTIDYSEEIKSSESNSKKRNIFRRLYLKYKIKTRKKEIYSNKEQNVINIVRKLCSNKNSIINHSNFGYLINNNENHVSCLITSKSVIITNSVITSEKDYSENIIKKLNKFCENRVSNDCKISIKDMLKREDNMLETIIKSL